MSASISGLDARRSSLARQSGGVRRWPYTQRTGAHPTLERPHVVREQFWLTREDFQTIGRASPKTDPADLRRVLPRRRRQRRDESDLGEGDEKRTELGRFGRTHALQVARYRQGIADSRDIESRSTLRQ